MAVYACILHVSMGRQSSCSWSYSGAFPFPLSCLTSTRAFVKISSISPCLSIVFLRDSICSSSTYWFLASFVFVRSRVSRAGADRPADASPAHIGICIGWPSWNPLPGAGERSLLLLLDCADRADNGNRGADELSASSMGVNEDWIGVPASEIESRGLLCVI